MEFKIVDTGEIRIIGKGIRTRLGNNQNHRDISAFWEESRRNGFIEALEKERGGMGLFGVCEDFDPEEESFTYFIGIEKKGTNVPNGWEETVLPPSRYAVFPVRGPMPDSVRDAWDRIFSEWLSSSEYEHAGGSEFELFPNGVENDTDENYYCEVWIPVVEK
ncbi:MAG: AraC family transcriptional regulator [Bacillaceae bacterium]|nr:AraC family transcriptional regulator [Bacillaceae bacterium]